MYEEFFGLNQRPFSAVPNVDDFVGGTPLMDALDSVIQCVSHARGIAVVISAPGMGKTMLCKRVASQLKQDFRSLYMGAGGLDSRRALLQSILFELGVDYVGLTEQEARLRLFRSIKSKSSDGNTPRYSERGLLLILDDAQLMHSSLFDELRTLADYAPDGPPLMRIVLCGGFELEEKLADPALTSFNQRIGVHACLSPLTMTESASFIRQRLLSCGATDITSILTDRAMELICLASDGNLRCLTQLTDHSMLLAFGMDRQPIDEELVRAALDDLKELPLRWNEIPPASTDDLQSGVPYDFEQAGLSSSHGLGHGTDYATDHGNDRAKDQETDEFPIPVFLNDSTDPAEPSIMKTSTEQLVQTPVLNAKNSPADEPPPYVVYEVGGDEDENLFIPATPNTSKATTEIQTASCVPTPHLPGLMRFQSKMQESPVLDRYAMLDRYLELPEERRSDFDFSLLPELDFERTLAEENFEEQFEEDFDSVSISADWIDEGSTKVEQHLLKAIHQLRRDVKEQIDKSTFSPIPFHTHRFDIVEPEPEVTIPFSVTEKSVESTKESVAAEPTSAAPSQTESRFAQLFTRLRSRRKRLHSEQAEKTRSE